MAESKNTTQIGILRTLYRGSPFTWETDGPDNFPLSYTDGDGQVRLVLSSRDDFTQSGIRVQQSGNDNARFCNLPAFQLLLATIEYGKLRVAVASTRRSKNRTCKLVVWGLQAPWNRWIVGEKGPWENKPRGA